MGLLRVLALGLRMDRISTDIGTAKLKKKAYWTKSQKQEVWCSLGKEPAGRSAQVRDEENQQADADGMP